VSPIEIPKNSLGKHEVQRSQFYLFKQDIPRKKKLINKHKYLRSTFTQFVGIDLLFIILSWQKIQ